MKKIILGAIILGIGILFCIFHSTTFEHDRDRLEGYFGMTSQMQLHKKPTDFVYKERDFD